MATLPVEPTTTGWRPMPLGAVLDVLLTSIGPTKARPTIVAVDGRQGSGKSTLARHLADLVPESVVVHSDDVAWWESFFGWDHLMATGILDPLRRAESVDYRPPAWKRRGREGSIVVPSSAPLVIVEGVGSSRISLTPVIDAAVWVQSDWDEANRRGIAREGGGRAETDFWWEWDREEQPFLAHDRPWERAEIIVCGTPELTTVEHDPATQVLVGNTLAAKAQA